MHHRAARATTYIFNIINEFGYIMEQLQEMML
jgi:hypothetical protein